MYLLEQSHCEKKHATKVLFYREHKKQWDLETIFTLYNSRDFYECIKTRQYSIKYAIIGINQPYRNILYHFYPYIKVIIDKGEVIRLFEQIVGTDGLLYEEVAVSIELGSKRAYYAGDIRYFIYDFYHLSSKEEARAFYELWQMRVPINDRAISRFIRVMEYFLEEILNYFEFSPEKGYVTF